MNLEVVPLTAEHFHHFPLPEGIDRRAYFSPGSAAYCVLAEGDPVFAGGIVNLMWHRGEAWIVPTPFYKTHMKTCFRLMRDWIPALADAYGYHRVQATCVQGLSATLFAHLGFEFEARLAKFGPNGETCDMYSRIFEVTR